MDWFLYDRDLRHENVKEEQVLLRIGAVMKLTNPLFSVCQNWKKIFSNERLCSLYTGNTSILCRIKLTK